MVAADDGAGASPSCGGCDAVRRPMRRRRHQPHGGLLAAPGPAFGAALLLLLLTLSGAAAQGVLRGGAAVGGVVEREIGPAAAGGWSHLRHEQEEGPIVMPVERQEGDKGLLFSSPSTNALGFARLLPLGTYLLHLDVEGHFPDSYALPSSSLLKGGGGGDNSNKGLVFLASAAAEDAMMQPSSSKQQQSTTTDELIRPPRYSMLETFIELLFFDQRRVAESSPSRHPLLPMCGLVAPIVDTAGFCSVTAFVEARATRSPWSYARASTPGVTIYEHEKEPAQDAEHSLPQPLADLGTPVPHLVDAAVVQQERHTYYWLLRLVWNLYRYTKRWIFATPAGRAGDGSLAPPFVPAGWGDAKIYYWNVDDPRGKPPCAQSFVKGEHMVVILRGTIFNGGVVRDLEYDFADAWKSEKWGIKGQVHEGFLDLASQLFDPLRQEIEGHPNLTRVTFAGHSLGGAIIPLLIAHLRTRLPPTLILESVAFAGPNPGDQVFVDSLDALPNVRPRRVMYLGSGLKHPKGPYGVGDTVAQSLPPCWALPGCADTYAYKTGETFLYAMAGGNVPFYAEDMSGAVQWRLKELVFNTTASPAACHNCAYMCWASQGLPDPEDRCRFPNDPTQPQFPCVYSSFLDVGSDVDPNFGY